MLRHKRIRRLLQISDEMRLERPHEVGERLPQERFVVIAKGIRDDSETDQIAS
jgi:hypothetical protein